MSIAKKMVSVAGALAVLTACGTSPEGFVKDYSKLSCQVYEKCQKAYFVDQFDDQQECREEFEENIDDADFVDDCDFDEDEAKKCLDTLRDYRSTCDFDDYDYEDCWEVFTDCDGGGGGGGGGGGRPQTSYTYY